MSGRPPVAPGAPFAETSPEAADPRLRGRTLAIPFDRVWRVAVGLADGGIRGWRLVDADDREGIVRAEASSFLGGSADLLIRVGLDGNGQTRVDARSTSRRARSDFGANARRIAAFFRALDRSLLARGASPRGPVHRGH